MKISILGCGWLGLPLAKQWVRRGHQVKGSTTQADKLRVLRAAGIEPFWLQLTPEPKGIGWDYFLDSEVLIINIPPRLERAGADFHPAQMTHLLPLIAESSLQKIVYVSSTSVYPELNRTLVEADVQTPESSAAPALVIAENLIHALPQATVVLRMGGLMGYERIPAKYVSGKQNLNTGDIPVNYVHRDDAVDVVLRVVESVDTYRGTTFNVVAPQHPTRRQVYAASVSVGDFAMPTFVASSEQPFKIISSHKLCQQLDYEFIYDNPLTFFYDTQSP